MFCWFCCVITCNSFISISTWPQYESSYFAFWLSMQQNTHWYPRSSVWTQPHLEWQNTSIGQHRTWSIPLYVISEAPFGQLPVLEVGETKIAQSASIVRFLAKALGMIFSFLVHSPHQSFHDIVRESAHLLWRNLVSNPQNRLPSMECTVSWLWTDTKCHPYEPCHGIFHHPNFVNCAVTLIHWLLIVRVPLG